MENNKGKAVALTMAFRGSRTILNTARPCLTWWGCKKGGMGESRPIIKVVRLFKKDAFSVGNWRFWKYEVAGVSGGLVKF